MHGGNQSLLIVTTDVPTFILTEVPSLNPEAIYY